MGTRIVFEILGLIDAKPTPMLILFSNSSHTELNPEAWFQSAVDNAQSQTALAEAMLTLRYPSASGAHRAGDRVFHLVEEPYGDFEAIWRLAPDGTAERTPAPTGSGEDPAHLLPYEGGAVAICDIAVSGPDAVVERFATIADAEAFLGLSASIDPDKLAAGGYSIDAPLGLGSDDEAIPTAARLGFDVFYSMGNAYFTKGLHSADMSGWSRGYPNTVAAALAALATVEA